MKFYKRRLAPPKVVVQLWEAVNLVRQQKQIPNIERLAKYVGREYGMKPAELDEHLMEAINDGLIHSYKLVGSKGSKAGVQQVGYKVPDLADCNVSLFLLFIFGCLMNTLGCSHCTFTADSKTFLHVYSVNMVK
jgi:hypothetical protein